MIEYNVVIYLKHNSDYLDYDIVSDKSPKAIIFDIRSNIPINLKLGGLVYFDSREVAAIEIREIPTES